MGRFASRLVYIPIKLPSPSSSDAPSDGDKEEPKGDEADHGEYTGNSTLIIKEG